MTRDTIDFGIDLGTTNSSIAMYVDGKVEIIKNNDGFEYTPSAVWINKHNSMIVGREAKDHLEDDSENAASEFKRLMGSADKKTFARTGQSMSPEELSAEVLKELKANVRQRMDEEINAAVITVPAEFLLPENAATNRAGQLAGLTLTPLLQEPIAAAMAYGFQSQSDKVFWQVYDFGGGTFDTAIINVRDGLIEVINHGGDGQLGGKNIDWAIVESLLVPALTKDYKLADFKRGNKKWRAAFAKLKWHAEEAKIAVSRRNSFDISINFSKEDGFTEPYVFDYELRQSDVARIAEPFIIKSIGICKTVISEKRLAIGNIEKVLLVGGPTLAPYLREFLSDSSAGLGIPLEARVDPMTVVARGAALYASTERIPILPGHRDDQLDKGIYVITFPDWKFKGNDVEPIVAAKVEAPKGQSLEGLSVEFVNNNAKPAWRSGKLALKEGGLMTTLWADKNEVNVYQVELTDNTGRLLNAGTEPQVLTYDVGLIPGQIPLTHSLGLALVNNEFFKLIEKGTPLPARKRDIVHTVVDVHAGQEDNLLRIVVLEGENQRADRNQKISTLEISHQLIKRDIPAGSEVEVTINIDKSRMITTKAYIPLLDEEYENVISMEPDANAFNPKEFAKELDKEKKRLDEIKKKVNNTNDEKAHSALKRIEQEQMVQQVASALSASADNADDAKMCQNLLLELRKAIDTMADAVEWPALVKQAEDLIDYGKEVAGQHGTVDEKRMLQIEESKILAAIRSEDTELLEHQIDVYRQIVTHILQKTDEWPVIVYTILINRKDEMTDQVKATKLESEGIRALNANDPVKLTAINRELLELLPPGIRDGIIIGH